MARIRRGPGKPHTAIASYLVRRVDEEKRKHPSKSYAQIGRELGITQKDPARLIRKLRSGESSGRQIVPRLLKRAPGITRTSGRFVVAYQWWWIDRPGTHHWARVNIVAREASPLDIFRLRDDPRVHAAVQRHLLSRSRSFKGDNYPTSLADVDYRVDSVTPELTARAMPLIITGRYQRAS